MPFAAGFRSHKVFRNTTASSEDLRGDYQLAEVTNKSASEVLFYPNNFPEGGIIADGIPIPGNSTRIIPLTIYRWTASGAVDIVFYKA